jgi:hypothetical protein
MADSAWLTTRYRGRSALAAAVVCAMPYVVQAQAPQTTGQSTPSVPAWAQPGSASHTQVAPPQDFHQPSRNFAVPLGIFDGQSDVGAAALPGSATYDAGSGNYTINSAGYNVWYSRDEFRFLWKKMAGDISLAADITFPIANGYDDRKAVLIIRQDLDDDSKEAFAALHGAGMIQLAQRPQKGIRVQDTEYRIGGRGGRGAQNPDTLVTVAAKRIGIEKRGDSFALFVSVEGEPMHQFGPSIELHLDGPFYVGIGFCSHMPDKVDSAIFADVVVENAAGKMHSASDRRNIQ